MATILMLAEFFLLSLGLGVGFFTFLANTSETGAGFLKVVSSICGISVLVALTLHLSYGSFTDPQSILYYLSITCFLLIFLNHKDKKGPLMWLLFTCHNIFLTLILLLMSNNSYYEFFFALTSIGLLGAVTYAMIMGHWYLVTPKLSEKPLKIALYFTWVFMVIKLGWTVSGYLDTSGFFAVGTAQGGGYAFNWMLLSMRAGWGFLVLGIMSYFAFRLVAMRSIQSATGMLYAMTFFVFVGELISNYMYFEYGVFL